MELKADTVIAVFIRSVEDWHRTETESTSPNPYTEGTAEYLLYKKNQIDTIQWHVEDEIRRSDISDSELVSFKRKIDKLNQERTDTVELLDDLIFNMYKNITRQPGARMNSETPAWLIDRMSILELKIYHMNEQTGRTDVPPDHIKQCSAKLAVLLEQRKDLATCLNEMMDDLASGRKFFKVYRQMKMYNDKNLNPSLYKKA